MTASPSSGPAACIVLCVTGPAKCPSPLAHTQYYRPGLRRGSPPDDPERPPHRRRDSSTQPAQPLPPMPGAHCAAALSVVSGETRHASRFAKQPLLAFDDKVNIDEPVAQRVHLRPAFSSAPILPATSSGVPLALKVETISSLTACVARVGSLRSHASLSASVSSTNPSRMNRLR